MQSWRNSMPHETTNYTIPFLSALVSAAIAYFTTAYTIHRARNQGRLILLELVRRFFINVRVAFDPETQEIRSGPMYKKFYVEELKCIIKTLEKSLENPYFLVLISRYPTISMLLIQSRRELIEHEASESFALNPSTINEFSKLHQILSKDLPKSTSSDVDEDIRNLARFVKNSLILNRFFKKLDQFSWELSIRLDGGIFGSKPNYL